MNNDNVRQLRQPQGFVLDTLVNLLSGLGTSKDKTASTVFTFDPVNKSQLLFAYRGDWVARKIVDAPAQDATREWREWQAEKKEITQVEEAEKALRLQAKVKSAIQRSRLFGGAALVMGVDQGNPESELRIDKVRKGQLKYVHVLNRDEISVPELDLDVQSEFFAEPKMYVITSPRTGSIQVHPSRVIRFIGNEIPDIGSSTDGWGDSILQTVHDAVIHAGQTIANVAGIVNEAKIDVINIPGMMENMGTQEYRTRLTERFTLANTIKSITNTLMLDKEEEWNRLQASFAGLPDLIRVYLLIASGAADIPATRMLGQSASGFNATGTEDTRNYYDRVASDQKNDIAPRLDRLDEVMLRSIFGDKPDEFFYEWRSLWQMSETEKADVATKKATAFTADVNAGLLPPEVLREARENQLIEDGTYPGLEAAIEEYGAQNLDEYNQGVLQQMQARAALTTPDDPNDPNAAKKKAKAAQVELQRRKALPPPRPPAARGGDSIVEDATTPRSLYVRRDVLNGEEILAHFEEQGVDVSGVDPDELHVTVLYSRQPVDWIKMGESSYGHIGRGEDLADGVDMCVRAGGPRVMEAYGTPPDTLVMCFASSALCWRHQHMIYQGASEDYEDYNPHVSIAPWDGRNVRLVEPWQGEILLGPEIFEPTKTGGAAGVAADYDPSEPRAAAGSAAGGQWTREGAGSWAGRLHESMRDNAGFDAVVAELKSSKVTQPQMHKIATEFFTLELGHDPGYARSKSKGELLRKIVDWQALDARQRARLASHASDYDPSEPRAAAGSAAGGQWTREGAAAARQSRIDKVERERRARAEGDISARLRRTREAAVAKSRRITAAAAHKAIEFMRDKENRIEGVGVIADQLSGMFAGLDEVSSKMVRQMTADLARHFGDDVKVARGAVRRALSKAIEIRRGLTGDADEPEADDEILQTLLALLAMLGRETKGEVVDWRSALDYSPDQPRVPRGKEGGGQFTTQGGAGYSAVLRQAGIHARLIKVKRLESGKSFNAVYKKQPLNPQGNPQVIEVAQQVRGVRGKWNKNADQAGDFAAGAGWVALKEVPELGRFADQFWRDAAEFMTPKEYEYAKPYFATRDTAFTEGFRAAYSPNGKAFGLNRARTEEVFGRSTAQLRSGITEVFSPPKPGALARVGEKIAKLFGA